MEDDKNVFIIIVILIMGFILALFFISEEYKSDVKKYEEKYQNDMNNATKLYSKMENSTYNQKIENIQNVCTLIFGSESATRRRCTKDMMNLYIKN